MAQAALDAMRKEYDDMDAEPVRETIAGYELVGFDLNFFCLDLTNTARIRSVRVTAHHLHDLLSGRGPRVRRDQSRIPSDDADLPA